MKPLFFSSFFFVFTVKSFDYEITLQPKSQIIYEQGTATFYCEIGQGIPKKVVWIFNDTLVSEGDPNTAWNTYGGTGLRAILFRNTPVTYNDTRIQCQLQDTNFVSNNVTLLVQGVPSRVSEMAYNLHESGINVSWKAPFSLTVPPHVFPVITYCVDVNSKDLIHDAIATCHVRRTWYHLPKFYFEWISNVSIKARNSVGIGEATTLNFPSAKLRPVKVTVYTGTEVIFQCSYTGSYRGKLVWRFNGTQLNHRVHHTQEIFFSGYHVIKFTALSSHDNANIQCMFLYQYNYNTTSNVALLHVQGTLEVSLKTTVSMNILNISWDKPFTYIIPPNSTEESYYYCVLIRTEPGPSDLLPNCNITQLQVTVNMFYGLTYSVVVSVVNAVGKGLPAIADVIVPELLRCTVTHPRDDRRYIEAACSFNESILGYTAILYHSQLDHFMCVSTVATDETIVMKGSVNGLHYLQIFPLFKSLHLVGRRKSFTTSTIFSDIHGHRIVPIEYEQNNLNLNTETISLPVSEVFESQLVGSSFYQNHMLLYSIFGILGLAGGLIVGTLVGLMSTACLYKWCWRKCMIT